jgi:hypothetical protein
MSSKAVVDSIFKQYISEISKQYNIPEVDLTEIWNVKFSSNLQLKSSDESGKELSEKELLKLKKDELQLMCKDRGIKVSTSKTKDVIIKLLLQGNNVPVDSGTSKIQSKKVEEKATVVKPVLNKLASLVPSIMIHKNKHGNFEHSETGFVFDKQHRKVIGKQSSKDEKIEPLTVDDIDICNKYKFQFVLPTNLDKKENLDSIYVDELDDDEEINRQNSKKDVETDEVNDDDIELGVEEEEYEEEYEEEMEEEM